jgi:hypothetical protein
MTKNIFKVYFLKIKCNKKFSKKKDLKIWDLACENRPKKPTILELLRTTKSENRIFSLEKNLIPRKVLTSPLF